MEAKEYPKFDARGVREHYESKQRKYWKREVIKEVVEFLEKQGAVWVDKNYAIIKAIEKLGNVKTE